MTDPVADGLLLREERLVVGTERVAVERVRVTRRVVTEVRQLEVEVRREELHITRERLDGTPMANGEDVLHSGSGSAGDVVVVLSEEVPVVTLDVRPVERVTVSVETVQGTAPVAAVLRHEEVELDTSGVGTGR